MTKITKIGVLAVLLIFVISMGSYSDARAAKPYCNNVTHPLSIFRGNALTVSWTGSINLDRAFVVWPLDDRNHWAVYELTLTEESYGKTTSHEGYAFIDLEEGKWRNGQLVTILTENSAQEGHHPPQTPWTHGQLLLVLNLVKPEPGDKQPDGAPLCKAHLTPLTIRPVP